MRQVKISISIMKKYNKKIMTQTEKRILISDLCARLQYGVKVDCTDGVVQLESVDFELGSDRPVFWHNGIGTNLTIEEDNIKPYLFPLSSMTEEQYEKFIIISGWDGDIEDIRRGKFSCIGYIGLDYIYDTVDWFNKNHFDWRGLIPMGLAIDATDKNIY